MVSLAAAASSQKTDSHGALDTELKEYRDAVRNGEYLQLLDDL
jgi:hypothetical protein